MGLKLGLFCGFSWILASCEMLLATRTFYSAWLSMELCYEALALLLVSDWSTPVPFLDCLSYWVVTVESPVVSIYDFLRILTPPGVWTC